MEYIGELEQRCGILFIDDPDAAKLLTAVLPRQDVYQPCDSHEAPNRDYLHMQRGTGTAPCF